MRQQKNGRFTVEAEKADIDILLTMSEITLLPTTDSVSLESRRNI